MSASHYHHASNLNDVDRLQKATRTGPGSEEADGGDLTGAERATGLAKAPRQQRDTAEQQQCVEAAAVPSTNPPLRSKYGCCFTSAFQISPEMSLMAIANPESRREFGET